MVSRRDFIKTSSMACAGTLSGLAAVSLPLGCASIKPFTIQSVGSNFEREPLIRPFGFKGGYMTESGKQLIYCNQPPV